MKTKKLRILSLMLCLALAFSALAPSALAEEVEPPIDDPIDPDPYVYIASISAGLTIGGGGYATCSSSVRLYSSSNIAYLTMYLERSSNGTSGWSTVKSWSTSDYGGAILERHRYVSSGYYYRVYVSVTITNSSGTTIETAGNTSAVVYY